MKRAAKAASLLTTAVCIAVVVYVGFRRREDVTHIFEDAGSELVLIAALIVVGHFLNSAEFWLLYRAQGAAIGLWETWTLFLATQFGNLLPGQIGTLYRLRYMKVVHDFDYFRSGSNFGANLAITLGSSALSGLVGITVVAAGGGTFSPLMPVAVLALTLASIALLVFELPELPQLGGALGRSWRKFRDGWEAIRRQPRVAGKVLMLDATKYAVVAWRFQIAFGLLDVNEGYAYFLVIAPAAGLAGAIAFTPGGFGIREGFILAAAVGMGSSIDSGLLAATVDRGAMLLMALLVGSVGFVLTRRRMEAVAAARPALESPLQV